jgi:alkylhydroperoxidase family enzyme
VAREQGLSEAQVDHIADGYERSPLPAREIAALRFTDAIISNPRPIDAALQTALRQHFSDAQLVELGLGVGLFMALSKVMITLGLEPESMPTTVLPTPGGARGGGAHNVKREA